MGYQQFIAEIKSKIPIRTVIPNPGGGTSTILSYTEKNIAYRRKNSRITVAFEDLFNGYETF